MQYTYDSWGKPISITGTLADTIGVLNPLRYRGYYYDTNTGLYYLQSRYYDPETGRFINADTLIVAGDYLQGTNMYSYCLNNPIMYVDPTGRDATVVLLNYIIGIVFSDFFDAFTVKYDVPLYDQGGLKLCWAYCQVMVEDFQKGVVKTKTQADRRAKEIAEKRNGKDNWNSGGSPTNLGERLVVFENTDSILGIISLYVYLKTFGPLYALYHESENQPGHAVIVTGVDIFRNRVYTNNPWGIRGEQTYEEFSTGFASENGQYKMSLHSLYRFK